MTNMNDLLFIALLIALLYYFFIYLPSTKKSNPDPTNKTFTHPKSKPNDPDPNIIEEKFEEETHNKLYGPQHVECPAAILKKDEDTKELERVLDDMIKGMNELSKELD